MALTPRDITSATFTTARKGFAPDEVTSFLAEAASALESAQQQAAAMEARARAAVARLQEATTASEAAEAAATEQANQVHVGPDEAETISRTLLLAQRTADATVAEAQAEADRLLDDARAEATTAIEAGRDTSKTLVEQARTEAREASENERAAAESEVESLVARREFLVGDVDQLEQFTADQRERLRATARQIEALCDRVPGGLADVARPVLSASDDEAHEGEGSDEFADTPERDTAAAEAGDDTMELSRPTAAGADGPVQASLDGIASDDAVSTDEPGTTAN